MKAYLLLAALGVAMLGGCTTVYRDVAYTPSAPVAYATSPTYVAPGYTVVVPHY